MNTPIIRTIERTDNVAIADVIRLVLVELGAPKVGTAYEDKALGSLYEAYNKPKSVYFVVVINNQIVDVAAKEGVDFDEMWKFADEIHGNLGNRPKMYPGIIGGHCVIPNLNLIDYENLDAIKKINDMYEKFKK